MKIDKIVPILETERLVLRGILQEDTNNIVKWRSNPNVYPYFLSPHAISREEHLSWYNGKYLKDRNRFDWICLRKDTDERIGLFGMKRSDERVEEAEISYLISSDFQRYGYAREAVTRIIQWCKENGILQIKAVIHENNGPSIRFIENLGFLPIAKNQHFITYSDG